MGRAAGCFSSGRRVQAVREMLGGELGLGPLPPRPEEGLKLFYRLLSAPGSHQVAWSTQNQNTVNRLFFNCFSFFFSYSRLSICRWSVTEMSRLANFWSHLVVVQGGWEVGSGWWGRAARRAGLPLNPSQDVCRISWRRGGACLRRFPKSLCFFGAESLWFWLADFLICSRKM